MAFTLPPFLSPKHYTLHLFCKITVIVQKLILLCTRLLLWCRCLGVRLRLGVVVSVQCLFLRNLLHVFVLVLSSRCDVVISMWYLLLRNLLHVFVSVSSFRCGVFLYAIFYTSSSRLLPLLRSPTRLPCGVFLWCLRLGVFCYGNLLHVFPWVYSAMAISYTSSPWCLPLQRSPTRLLRLPCKRQSTFLNWLVVQ